MKHLLITTIAAVVLVGCGESQQSFLAPEAKPVEPVAEAAQPEPTTAKAPDISIQDAAKEGNIKAIKQHIAAGTDVNAKGHAESTPLHWAANGGHKEIAELLIAKGADVNAKSENGVTPLHMTFVYGHKEVAELLIAKGADVNAKGDGGLTPLHFATGVNYKKIVELLIAKGADVNAKDNRLRKTPLDVAIMRKHAEIADLLRKHGGKTGEELKAERK